MKTHTLPSSRFSPQAGIAIGPILFVLAILGMIAAFMASGSNGFGVASITDRVSADIQNQATLIRDVIVQCNTRYASYASLQMSGSPTFTPASDPYPASDISSGTAASALVCDPVDSVSLWANVSMPPAPLNFNPWYYIDAAASGGGRCIWTTPSLSNSKGSEGIVAGLEAAANKFSHGTGYNGTQEVIYDPASTSQKFVLWVTIPTGTPDSHCLP